MIENYITTKTVDYLLVQLERMPVFVFTKFRLYEVVAKLRSAKHYAKPDKEEVTTVWLNYDYPEDGKRFNRNIN